MIRKILLVIGMLLCFYPLVAKVVREKVTMNTTRAYETQVKYMDENHLERLKREAEGYNHSLNKEEMQDLYEQCLNPLKDGMMAVLTIPKMELCLPIYHGTSQEVLNEAVGHVYGSSLPIGGPSTHCLLAAHRGIPEAELFRHLDRLTIGDEFTIFVLGESMTYEVCEIQTILPEDTTNLGIELGKDRVSLITCTPYGIYTHRLVVTGERKEVS